MLSLLSNFVILLKSLVGYIYYLLKNENKKNTYNKAMSQIYVCVYEGTL